ncbi:SOS response-associated peptidase family protein [Brucella intermedia]|uniref:SOS response-associated peptidase family protein n=1 Tax=Brucella intermedia TaxID=94625 RepID=UPI002B05FB60|nr:SOS response-associated peptidase family protein [Brucella intermedia]
MCGRYTLYLPWSEIHRLYNLTLTTDQARNTQPRYNICPTQDVLFVTHANDGMNSAKVGGALFLFGPRKLATFRHSMRNRKKPIRSQCFAKPSKASVA